MSNGRDPLAVRRQQLLERIAVQRRDLKAALGVLRTPLALADVAWSAARFVRRHPLALMAGYGLVRVLAPAPVRHAHRWVVRGRRIAALFRVFASRQT